MIIGICGRKRSGKDSTAALLVAELGFKRIAFADKLKELAAAFLRMPLATVADDKFKAFTVACRFDASSFTAEPKHMCSVDIDNGDVLLGRDVLQRFGSAGRDTFGEDFWIDQAINTKDFRNANNIVITDVRFWNELEAVKRAGGLIVRVNRAVGADRIVHGFFAGEAARTDKVVAGHHTFARDGACVWPVGAPGAKHACGLPARSHPTHYSGDTHESETTLPDSGPCYDLVVESTSAAMTAARVMAWVKARGAP